MWSFIKRYGLLLSNNDNSNYTRVPDINKEGKVQSYTPAELDYILVDQCMTIDSYHSDMDRNISMSSDHVAIITSVVINEEEHWKELAEENRSRGIKWNKNKLLDTQNRLKYEEELENSNVIVL